MEYESGPSESLVAHRLWLSAAIHDGAGACRRGEASTDLHLRVVAHHQDGTTLDTVTRRVAFRTAKVIQQPLDGQPGTSFVFEVNGVRIFCGGSNWIPADSFLTEIKADRYRAWVELMVSVAGRDSWLQCDVQIKGNQNMLRVWGGGIYESEELYK